MDDNRSSFSADDQETIDSLWSHGSPRSMQFVALTSDSIRYGRAGALQIPYSAFTRADSQVGRQSAVIEWRSKWNGGTTTPLKFASDDDRADFLQALLIMLGPTWRLETQTETPWDIVGRAIGCSLLVVLLTISTYFLYGRWWILWIGVAVLIMSAVSPILRMKRPRRCDFIVKAKI